MTNIDPVAALLQVTGYWQDERLRWHDLTGQLVTGGLNEAVEEACATVALAGNTRLAMAREILHGHEPNTVTTPALPPLERARKVEARLERIGDHLSRIGDVLERLAEPQRAMRDPHAMEEQNDHS